MWISDLTSRGESGGNSQFGQNPSLTDEPAHNHAHKQHHIQGHRCTSRTKVGFGNLPPPVEPWIRQPAGLTLTLNGIPPVWAGSLPHSRKYPRKRSPKRRTTPVRSLLVHNADTRPGIPPGRTGRGLQIRSCTSYNGIRKWAWRFVSILEGGSSAGLERTWVPSIMTFFPAGFKTERGNLRGGPRPQPRHGFPRRPFPGNLGRFLPGGPQSESRFRHPCLAYRSMPSSRSRCPGSSRAQKPVAGTKLTRGRNAFNVAPTFSPSTEFIGQTGSRMHEFL